MIWWYTIFHVYGLQIPRLSSEKRKFLFWEPILRLKLHLIRGFLALALTTTTHKKLFVEEIEFPCRSCIESSNCDFLIPLCEMLRSPVVYNVHNRHRLYLTSISDDISHKQKKRHSCGLKRSVVLCIQGEQLVVMGRTPFYRTSIELEHHFSNIERTHTCSSIGDRTRTPYFWLRTNEHPTL